MKKSFLAILFITTIIYANNIDDIIVSENYIPHKNCKIIKNIKVDDNKSLTKEQIYKKLKYKALKLGANAVLNTTYNNILLKKYISGDAAKCNIEKSPSLQTSVKVFTNNKKLKFDQYTHNNQIIESLFSDFSIEIGITHALEKTIYAGLSYSTKDYYEMYGHVYYLESKNPKARDLGYILGIRHYLFTNTKYENIRATLSYGIQDFEYINSNIKKYNGLNLGLGYISNKDSGLSVDLFYKTLNHLTADNFEDHLQLNIGYRF